MALLSFRGISTPSLNAQGEQRRSSLFNIPRDIAWISRITLVDSAAPEHPAPPMAGFLSPAPPETVGSMAGVTLTGYAFCGPEPVGKVELSTDDGRTYQAMPLPPQPDPRVWITWDVTFRPPERGFYVLRVKAASAGGRKQDFPGVIAVDVR